jgi:hypothetical protein
MTLNERRIILAMAKSLAAIITLQSTVMKGLSQEDQIMAQRLIDDGTDNLNSALQQMKVEWLNE